MNLLLDTNVVSELRKVTADKADPHVARWAASVPATHLFVSVVTLHELEHGVLLAERRDAAQGRILRAWFDERVMVVFERRILDVDVAVARRVVGLHVADPRPVCDALIAATALVHDMSLATRNVRDFASIDGLELVDPWAR